LNVLNALRNDNSLLSKCNLWASTCMV